MAKYTPPSLSLSPSHQLWNVHKFFGMPQTTQPQDLTIGKDYSASSPPSQPLIEGTLSKLLFVQSTPEASTTTGNLQGRPTIAVSLPDSVYAKQQDGMRNDKARVVAAPDFSDSTSVESNVPTINTRDHDVPGIISEILDVRESFYSDCVTTGAGSYVDSENDKSSTEWISTDEGRRDSIHHSSVRLTFLQMYFYAGNRSTSTFLYFPLQGSPSIRDTGMNLCYLATWEWFRR